jgi:hypothetical protein
MMEHSGYAVFKTPSHDDCGHQQALRHMKGCRTPHFAASGYEAVISPFTMCSVTSYPWTLIEK